MPFLTLNQVPSPTRVYDHTLEKAAHRADVLRILALQKLGGIYLDLDMFMWVCVSCGYCFELIKESAAVRRVHVGPIHHGHRSVPRIRRSGQRSLCEPQLSPSKPRAD